MDATPIVSHLDASNRHAVRFKAYNGVSICLTEHARRRAIQRGIDIRTKLEGLKGVPLKDYRKHGVIARYSAGSKTLIIITMWK